MAHLIYAHRKYPTVPSQMKYQALYWSMVRFVSHQHLRRLCDANGIDLLTFNSMPWQAGFQQCIHANHEVVASFNALRENRLHLTTAASGLSGTIAPQWFSDDQTFYNADGYTKGSITGSRINPFTTLTIWCSRHRPARVETTNTHGTTLNRLTSTKFWTVRLSRILHSKLIRFVRLTDTGSPNFTGKDLMRKITETNALAWVKFTIIAPVVR